jgi:hypothetical protein
LLRYEDLLAQPEEHFGRLTGFLDLPSEPALIRQTVANTCFEKLRAKEEEEGGFHERPDGCERFFRSGRSGEGREQLNADQLAQLGDAFSSTFQQFGYEVSTRVHI